MAKKVTKKAAKNSAKKIATKTTKRTSLKKSAPKADKKATKKQTQQSYVQYSTISDSVGSKTFKPGELKVCNVGKHKVIVQKHDRLDRNGKPIHTAAVLKSDGSLHPSHTGNSINTTVSRALGKSGVKTKWNKTKKAR